VSTSTVTKSVARDITVALVAIASGEEATHNIVAVMGASVLDVVHALPSVTPFLRLADSSALHGEVMC